MNDDERKQFEYDATIKLASDRCKDEAFAILTFLSRGTDPSGALGRYHEYLAIVEPDAPKLTVVAPALGLPAIASARVAARSFAGASVSLPATADEVNALRREVNALREEVRAQRTELSALRGEAGL